ncbi:uncharacterized protein CC84DRAFT_1194815 [Paraphaeosphaeria sporulosa]|uniref:Transcriptional activator of proteases prtT n=1 Tax=Paraphaeosphaeria sporulosa TaxID=1460663 RepID=A0A177CN56_9PLEO|nr:uncharacterized protein CC84DRAFT_1194815 [Paraphaeosphaeria sporulosa]OAG08726.1 hypothetical protein CC84DRAFT_1194815 [Paraphaeosphaeria sporulosa]
MPVDRGRASKACAACRKQKTRCYETTAGRACLRCDRIGQECSLTAETPYSRPTFSGNPLGDSSDINDERVERLERLVTALARRLDDVESELYSQNGERKNRQNSHLEVNSLLNPESETGEQVRAPLFVLRDVTAQSGVRRADRGATNTPSRAISDDIILKGLLTEEEASSLLALFQENYGRWVSFNATASTARLLEDVRKSPLLLTACCLIAVRHVSQELASRLAPKLFQDAKLLLSQALLSVPQPIEFFQASLVLSMWSTTIGQLPLGIDSWLLSGFALQHSIASGLFAFARGTRSTALEQQDLDRLCIWNHLCLVHLHYCVGTRRKSVLDEEDIHRSRLILGSHNATNFESRMVAEVHLYWVIYRNCSEALDLPRTQESLSKWKEEWGWLLDQPRSQFVQMGFYFAQLMAYDQSLKTGSSAVRESLLSEMVRLSSSIINLAMNTTDERTRHLTDHIYHMISFAAVTLCRLLSNYEEQLSLSHDLSRLDETVLSLVSWLHAIGFPCHVAYTMGDVVAAFHKKLRPNTGPSPNTSYLGVDPAIQDDFALLFPEFYGNSSFDLMHGSILPDFQPLV